MLVNLTSASIEQTTSIGKSIGSHLIGGEVIELISDLGGGKTTLVKGLVEGSGSESEATSPSFTITNEYLAPSFRIYHFDFYRLSDVDPGIIRRQLAEVLGNDNNVTIIEWPIVVENVLPEKRLVISFSAKSETERDININYPAELDYLLIDLK